MEIRRGDVFMADLSPVLGSEQGGLRPVAVVQNDIGNRYSPTIICVAITSKLHKAKLPTHIELLNSVANLPRDSILLGEQIRTIDKSRLREKVGIIPQSTMRSVDKALVISLGLINL